MQEKSGEHVTSPVPADPRPEMQCDFNSLRGRRLVERDNRGGLSLLVYVQRFSAAVQVKIIFRYSNIRHTVAHYCQRQAYRRKI